MMMQVLTALGGVGMFLLGMELMTAALREFAGGGLRRRLARLTASPLRGAVAGFVATALIQSSSAVSLITIGAVGAGLLSFAQALGVLLGANVGTTVTGWMVMVLGLKLQLGAIALPVLFCAALLSLFGQARLARTGRALAGFALLFIGLDMMAQATAGAEALLRPEMLPGDTWPGRLLLAGMGLVLVAVIQSSSAGIALALVLLGSDAISFAQAAALSIGFDLGTTAKGFLASAGGTRPMRLTAVANTLFNLGTAAMALALLDLVVPLLRATSVGADDQAALVIFHTGFNLLGAMVFLPVTAQFAALVERLVPERRAPLTEALDPRLLADPGTAIDAAQGVADRLRLNLFTAIADALGPAGDLRGLAARTAQGATAIPALETYLAAVRIAPDQRAEHLRYASLLHQIDHSRRLLERCAARDRIAMLRQDGLLRRDVAALACALARPRPASRLSRLAALIDRRAARFRRAVILREHAGLLPVSEVFARTDAMRWLARVADHAARLTLHSEEAKTAA